MYTSFMQQRGEIVFDRARTLRPLKSWNTAAPSTVTPLFRTRGVYRYFSNCSSLYCCAILCSFSRRRRRAYMYSSVLPACCTAALAVEAALMFTRSRHLQHQQYQHQHSLPLSPSPSQQCCVMCSVECCTLYRVPDNMPAFIYSGRG